MFNHVGDAKIIGYPWRVQELFTGHAENNGWMPGLAGYLKYGQFYNHVRRHADGQGWPTFRPDFHSCSAAGLAGFLKYQKVFSRLGLAGFLKYRSRGLAGSPKYTGLGLAGFLKYRRKRSALGLADLFKYRPGMVLTLENRVFNEISNLA